MMPVSSVSRPRPLALLSQRVDVVPSYKESRDALDQAWISLLDGFGFDAVAVANHAPIVASLVERLGPALIILTGGNGVLPGDATHSPERNATESALLTSAASSNIPVLGVCRGFQFMNVHLGGTLRRVSGHVARPHEVQFGDGSHLAVNSFHDFGIMPQDLAMDLEVGSLADDGSIETARHRELPWTGIMWHPERAMPDSHGNQQWFSEFVRKFRN